MAAGTLSLWSADIRAEIQSPFAVLSVQAEALGAQTKGVLVGELVKSQSEDKKRAVLLLDMYAPALDYRHRVLSASHDKSLVYPVVIDADIFRPKTIADGLGQISPEAEFAELPGSRPQKRANEAASDDELIVLIKQVLRSPEVVSIAVSLIAKSEDTIREKESAARTELAALAAGQIPE